jgi:hypothetical protein
MYSLDLNIQSALDRKAELLRAVQSVNLANVSQPAAQVPPARWPALIRAAIAVLSLVWLVR